MQKMKSIPNCANSFVQKYLSNHKLLDTYNLIGRPRPFDVTLRDGLQALSKEEQILFTTEKKINMYNDIIIKHFPKNIEIGSYVSEKVLPIFKDTEKLFEHSCKMNGIINNYILVPNLNKLQNALKIGAKNFSFITSVSNHFQLKNTRLSIAQNEENIANMLSYLDDYTNLRVDKYTGDIWKDYQPYNVKLYVSCINECPVADEKLDNDAIVLTLKRLSKFNANKICLSDTCGTLEPEDFINILRNCKKYEIDITKFSLHLHVKPERERIVEELVFIALDNGINEFDVSALSTGGCSVTMDSSKIAPNMNYEQYYKFLTNYLITRS